MAPLAPRRQAQSTPSTRSLRVYAFDPGVGARVDTLSISQMRLDLLWEESLRPGPVGEYLEVIDFDPPSEVFYEPVDLNHPHVLAQDGLEPAEGVPQFHQQMVFAVAMNTIYVFERALGRVALWSDRVIRDKDGQIVGELYVPRLRIYPHALREANAYYSPVKKSLLFGYFPAPGRGPGQVRGGMVFTALSFDVVAHETTHALLDGLHPSFNEATNADVRGLHEGFADIVALLQRFSCPDIVEHQIARTRGDLEQQSMLGQLAQQFGLALGMRGALRDALGGIDKATGTWRLREPDPTALRHAQEAHERGGILLAAVFLAFLTIYKSRSADLFRIASNGTGVLAAGEIHPDLVRRLAREAATAAEAVLTMCIRGLDYCPPVDIDFGTYLRGIVTADAQVFPADERHYRVALIDAFRQWGIYPEGVRSMSSQELCYRRLDDDASSESGGGPGRGNTERRAQTDIAHLFPVSVLAREPKLDEAQSASEAVPLEPSTPGDPLERLLLDWDLTANRRTVWRNMRHNAKLMHGWLLARMATHSSLFGLTRDPNAPRTVFRSRTDKLPSIEVHSVRVARRRGYRDMQVPELVVEVRQRRRGYYDPEVQRQVDAGRPSAGTGQPWFRFRRGCTIIIDPVEQRIRYVIRTRGDVCDNDELERVRRFLTGAGGVADNSFYAGWPGDDDEEHFAALHRHGVAAQEF